MVIQLIKHDDAAELEKELNSLGPIQLLAIYAINQRHFAWVKRETAKPKAEKKGKN